MKRYNKQQVMKDAHRLYKNDFQRRGRSWGECLKAAYLLMQFLMRWVMVVAMVSTVVTN